VKPYAVQEQFVANASAKSSPVVESRTRPSQKLDTFSFNYSGSSLPSFSYTLLKI